MFQLDEGGQARGPGIPVTGVSRPETHEIDGSLTPDMCTLYFVTWVDDKLRVMRSRRER